MFVAAARAALIVASAVLCASPQQERASDRFAFAPWVNAHSMSAGPPMGTATKTYVGAPKTAVIPTAAVSAAADNDVYHLHQSNRGNDFYRNGNWRFWIKDDPTHGQVKFIDHDEARDKGLIGLTNDGRAFAQASTENLRKGAKRPSVRFHSRASWDAGLIIFDVTNMPVGCATWPALWTCDGVNWPVNGEIDVMEGIGFTSNGRQANLMSVHLNETSHLSTPDGSYTGEMTSNDCKTSYGLGNTGCSFRDRNENGVSWGLDFNAANGGIWALQFGDGQGVKVWFWGRHSGRIPTELSFRHRAPSLLTPSQWGKPMANFQSKAIDRQILAQQIIMDITIGGDWAGHVAMDDDCGDDVTAAIAKGSNYDDAVFVFNGIDVYCLGNSHSCVSSRT